MLHDLFANLLTLESLILLTAFMVKYISISIVDFRLQGAAGLGLTGANEIGRQPGVAAAVLLLVVVELSPV